MITRPSTPRILEDVCEQLMRDVMPGIADPAAQIRLHMLIATLNSCANASAAEISLMKQEIALYGEFAQEVATATGDATVQEKLDALQPTDSLLLADVAAEYARAGYAFTAAMDLVMDQRNAALIEKGEELLQRAAGQRAADPQRQFDDRPFGELAEPRCRAVSSAHRGAAGWAGAHRSAKGAYASIG